MAPSTKLGTLVWVRLDTDIYRPMLVTATRTDVDEEGELATIHRASGTIFCEPEDHTTVALRTLASQRDDARIHGRPDRMQPVCYGELLRFGTGIGEWLHQRG